MLRSLFRFFSHYAHPFEKKVDRFFKHIKSTSRASDVQSKLQALMQENLVVTNLWMERKYKNYVYLKKRVRRKMYENIEALKLDFEAFVAAHPASIDAVRQHLKRLDLPFPEHATAGLLHLATIMAYLKPGERYRYQASANFGKLLKNPQVEPLVGDCNQIVTFYIYLYSLHFPLSDLQIKILPGHVCLHFQGIDIEATNATFQKYEAFDYVLPVTEIVSTNLLDIVDNEAETREVDPRTVLKRAQLAYHISSMKELVDKNLKVAYRNLSIVLLKQKNFSSALFYADKLADYEFINTVCNSAAVHYLNKKDFSQAEHYINRSGNESLREALNQNKGIYYYQNKNYEQALIYFRKISDERMIKACYQGFYNLLVPKIKNVKTIQDAKRFRSTYQKMVEYARLADNPSAAESIEDILGKL